MILRSRKARFYFLSFLKYDLKASVTVFFVALPLCLGVALASNAPLSSGLIAGIVGGLLIPLISRSELSVSGPAAGLTAICAAAVTDLGGYEIFFICVSIAGLLQLLIGVFKLGGFTHFIPSSVIKGMLTAIGIILITKQIPSLIGYGKPDFWSNELFNIFTLNHVYSNIKDLYASITLGAIVISIFLFVLVLVWENASKKKLSFLPISFVIVLAGSLLAYVFRFIPGLQLQADQFVNIPTQTFSDIHFLTSGKVLFTAEVWKYSVVICFVATLETLLSVTAIDKLDKNNRVTPQNREMVAQGVGNIVSGLAWGLPITAVIVRSAANAEAGARTKLSAFFHGVLLFLAVTFAASIINYIPYCVLAVILIRTGYNLASPAVLKHVVKQGREQWLPYTITVIAILFTDLLIGVGIGIAYAIYFLMKHTYYAGFTISLKHEGHMNHYVINMASNVSFLNKKKFLESLDKMPPYSIVEVDGTGSFYIDHDILEMIQEFKPKARNKHIQLILTDIPDLPEPFSH